MVTKTLTLGGAAALALAGGIVVATPAFAWTHHHRAHAMHDASKSSLSSPAEKQQTAELNRQQLTQPGAAGAQATNAQAQSGAAGNAPMGAGTGTAGYGQTGYSPATGTSPGAPQTNTNPGGESSATTTGTQGSSTGAGQGGLSTEQTSYQHGQSQPTNGSAMPPAGTAPPASAQPDNTMQSTPTETPPAQPPGSPQ